VQSQDGEKEKGSEDGQRPSKKVRFRRPDPQTISMSVTVTLPAADCVSFSVLDLSPVPFCCAHFYLLHCRIECAGPMLAICSCLSHRSPSLSLSRQLPQHKSQ
jgi:hypothetical protein